jgi:hypothetical protein
MTDFYKIKSMVRNDFWRYLQQVQLHPESFSAKEFEDVVYKLMSRTGFSRKTLLKELHNFGLEYDEDDKVLVKYERLPQIKESYNPIDHMKVDE